MTKYVLTIILLTGLFLSFHDTYWPWAIIPAGIIWGLAGLGLYLESREHSR